MRRTGILAAFATATIMAATPAHAQELVADSGDTGWTLAATLITLLAILGLALLYGNRDSEIAGHGVTRSLRTLFSAAAGVTLLWILIGYSIAFSPTGGSWLGDGFNWMLNNLSTVRGDSTIAESAFVLFQLALALLASLLAIGAVMGRANAGWAAIFATLWSLIVYAPLAYWLWSGGWLANLGAVDGAGGLVIMLSGGASALIAAMIAGQTNAHNHDDNDDDSPWPLIGTALLSIGLLGVIGGAEFAATDDAAMAIINALASGSAAALVWAGLASRLNPSSSTAPGFLAGLSAAMASAGFISPGGAVIIGAVAGLFAFFATRSLAGRLGRANTIFGTHVVAAIVGALLVAIFRDPSLGGTGFPTGTNMVGQLVAQSIGIAITGLWAIIGSLIVGYSAAIIWKPES